jgi:hypothetical protein
MASMRNIPAATSGVQFNSLSSLNSPNRLFASDQSAADKNGGAAFVQIHV